ncbi:MAG: hypothetical protein ACE5EK_02370 [Nitrospinales bacterium]
MKKKFTFKLDEKLYQYIHDLCQGNEEAMNDWVTQALEHQITKEKELKVTDSDKKLDASGLQDYLKTENPGSRKYGIKGQGW